MIHRNSKLQEFSSFESLTTNGSRFQFPVSGKLQFPGNSFPISGNRLWKLMFHTISTVHALGRLDCLMVRPHGVYGHARTVPLLAGRCLVQRT